MELFPPTPTFAVVSAAIPVVVLSTREDQEQKLLHGSHYSKAAAAAAAAAAGLFNLTFSPTAFAPSLVHVHHREEGEGHEFHEPKGGGGGGGAKEVEALESRIQYSNGANILGGGFVFFPKTDNGNEELALLLLNRLFFAAAVVSAAAQVFPSTRTLGIVFCLRAAAVARVEKGCKFDEIYSTTAAAKEVEAMFHENEVAVKERRGRRRRRRCFSRPFSR